MYVYLVWTKTAVHVIITNFETTIKFGGKEEGAVKPSLITMSRLSLERKPGNVIATTDVTLMIGNKQAMLSPLRT